MNEYDVEVSYTGNAESVYHNSWMLLQIHFHWHTIVRSLHRIHCINRLLLPWTWLLISLWTPLDFAPCLTPPYWRYCLLASLLWMPSWPFSSYHQTLNCSAGLCPRARVLRNLSLSSLGAWCSLWVSQSRLSFLVVSLGCISLRPCCCLFPSRPRPVLLLAYMHTYVQSWWYSRREQSHG